MTRIDSAVFTYTGRDNLEAMQQAHRYNAYLKSLVVNAGGDCEHWLDFGAGSGQFALPFTREGRHLVALEPDEVLVQGLVSQGVKACADIQAIPDASIDFAYSLNVLEHIEDENAALKMLSAKLKPAAKLLIYVPAFQVLYSEMDRLVGHHRRYRKQGLQALVAGAGFKVTQCEYVDSLGYLASMVYKLLPGQTGTITPGSVAAYDRFVFPISRCIDPLTKNWLGKNLVLTAVKAESAV